MASFGVICTFVLALAVFGNLVGTNELLWSEEFNGKAGSQPSKDVWTYTVGEGSYRRLKECTSNSELQYYTDDPSNVALDGQGSLVISTRPRNSPQDFDNCVCGNCHYTSALLVSKFKRRYGRFEARMKLPSGQGVWPAFTLLGDTIDCVGWPNTGEIDVMEMRGSRPNTILGSIHGPGYSGGISSMFTLQGGQTFEDDFHVFAIDWEANRITWSVDGDVYVSRNPDDLGQSPWVFDHPFHVVINLAVGGLFDGAPTADVKFPKQLLVDYIRVYEKAEGFSISYSNIMSYNTNIGPLVWSAEFNSANGTTPADQWNYDLTDGPVDKKGWGNNEHQYYTNETANCATDGMGHLVISARNDNTEPYTCIYGKCLYTSARLTTFKKFGHRYGRFEARLKIPLGKGLWPAFWLLGDNIEIVPWPKCGSIALEWKGSLPNVVTATINGPGYQGNRGIQAVYKLPGEGTFADDFHVFAIDWEPNRLTFSVDDTAFSTMTPADLNGNPWVFDHSFHILLNLAVGGTYSGYPPKDTVFPKMYYIDYVRVYDLV